MNPTTTLPAIPDCPNCIRAEKVARARRIARLVHEVSGGWVIAQYDARNLRWSASMAPRHQKATGCSSVSGSSLGAVAADSCVRVYATRAGAVRALGDDGEVHFCADHNRVVYASMAAEWDAEMRENEARWLAEEREAQARAVAEHESRERAMLAQMRREDAARRDAEERAVAEERARYAAHASAVRASLRVGGRLAVPTTFGAQERPLTIVALHDEYAVCRTERGETRSYRYDGRRIADPCIDAPTA